MLKQTLVITVAIAAISLVAPGAGSAEVACNPHCAPTVRSNSGGTEHGLNRANTVAGDHGDRGRDNAEDKQNAHKPGGSGVSSTGSTGGSTGGTGTGTGGSTGGTTTPGPCTGC